MNRLPIHRSRDRVARCVWALLLLVKAVDLHAFGADDHGAERTLGTSDTFFLCQAEEDAPASHAEAARPVSPEDCLVCQHREHSSGSLLGTADEAFRERIQSISASLPAAPPRPPHGRAGHGRAPPHS